MHTLWTFTGRAYWPRTPISPSNCSRYQSSIALLPQLPALKTWQPRASHSSATDGRSHARRIKLEELMDSLSRERANPSRVWNVYLELSSVMGFDDVPFEIQQQVLRKCVPRTDTLRVAAARRMQANNQPRSPHIYESRLQTLIGHMRASGRKPALEDYNFILEQFAAVGHQTGARHVFRELTQTGIVPSYRTYGLCLQAIAHRLTLPCPFRLRQNMLDDANSMCLELLNNMWTQRVPMTSVNFDLVHRIFKETEARSTFERLLKLGYGIDLANPDRPPLDTEDGGFLMGKAVVPENALKTLPFTTAALNTLIDMLGNTKQISRMVMAFEVFTTPLPPPPSSNSLSEDEEDDDPAFYQFSSSENGTQHEPPCVVPNTTTFNLLVRYACKAKHAVFARHYVVQAMRLYREKDAQLRAHLISKPLGEIASPNFSINRGTLLPPYGLANRTRHFAFLRWSYRQTTLAWNRKRESLAFYTKWRQDHVAPEPQILDATPVDEHHSRSVSRPEDPSNSPAPSSSSPAVDSTVAAARRTPVIPDPSEVLQIDLDATPPPLPTFKKIDLDLHISLLARDVEEIGELVRRMKAAVERFSQRTKERLGRRVWRGKDLFLMSRNKRVYVSRGEWMEMVRFQAPGGELLLRSSGENGPGKLPSCQRPPHLLSQSRQQRISPLE